MRSVHGSRTSYAHNRITQQTSRWALARARANICAPVAAAFCRRRRGLNAEFIIANDRMTRVSDTCVSPAKCASGWRVQRACARERICRPHARLVNCWRVHWSHVCAQSHRVSDCVCRVWGGGVWSSCQINTVRVLKWELM